MHLRTLICVPFLVAAAIVTASSPSAAQPCIAPPSGLTSWWPGDGDAADPSSGNDGSLQGGATFGAGLVNQAFQLDGIDSFVDVPSTAALQVGTGDFTVDLWVNFNDTSGEQVLIEKWIDGNSGWTLTKLDGNSIHFAQPSGSNLYSPGQTLPTGTWIHFAARREAGNVAVFMNGNEIVSGPIASNLDSPSSLMIGRRSDPRGFFLNGLVDEVHLFVGRALSNAEIQSIHAAGSGGLCQASVCGDGVRQGIEECDDGNMTPDDGCENDCTSSCGNGTPTGAEECDDGNGTNGDGCDNNCRITGCPNGAVSAPELCDDDNMIDTDACKSDCTPNTCGDGVVHDGVEDCDDANAIETDGCESDCTFGDVCIAPLPGLGGWWPGDDSIGDIAGGRNAVLQGGADYTAGKVGRGFVLDGDDDFVSVPSHASLNVGSGDFTVDLWARFDSTDGEQVLLEKYVQKFDDEASSGWTLTKLDRNVVRFVTAADGVDTSRLTIPSNVWVHFAARRSGAELAIFMNGVAVGSATAGEVADLSSSSSLKFGHRGGPADTAGSADTRGFWLRGGVDEVHLFGRALSNAEILALYDSGKAGLCVPSPVCGNGLTEAGEACDDGNAVADDGCESDCTSSCGNGTTAGDEECDDANLDDGDGCDTNCTVSACGNSIAAGGEECDDGNPEDGDGCDTNCTATACGNGVRTAATGEGCDDGNLVDGDGCESDCGATPVVETVPPGGTVTTDPGGTGATPQAPIQVGITTPGGGEVLIAASDEPLSEAGVHALIQQLLIEAEPTSALEPLVIVVTIDASAIPPGVDLLRVDLTRNGEILENCSGAPGVAAPDPCIQSRVLLPDGDVQITGLTSRASLWGAVVRGLSKLEQKCVGGANRAGSRVAAAQSKLAAACMKAANAGKLSDAEACVAADADQAVSGAEEKTVTFADDACAAPPPFAFSGAPAINAAARAAKLALVDDVLGSDLNLAVTSDKDLASCQSSVLKTTERLFATKTKLLLGCLGDGLAGTPQLMVSANDLDACLETLDADPDSKAAKSVGKLAGALVDRCAGIPLADVLPGSCGSSDDVSYCLETRVDCRLCQMLNAMDGAVADCDAFDDGAVNTSCD